MLTFQDIYEEVQDLTADSSSTATTKHKLRINETYALFLRRFNKRTSDTITTVASTQSYEIPNTINKISSVKGTVSSIDYPMIEILNEDEWNTMNDQGTAYTSAIPSHYYIQDNNILVFPTPSASYTITVYGTQKDKVLSADNYTTSTVDTVPYTATFTAIVASGAVSATLSAVWPLATGTYQIIFSNGDIREVTLTNASAAVTWTTGLTAAATATITVNNSVGGSIVTGTAPTWTALMVGRFLNITNDGYWYKIYSYIDATHITLEKVYEGTAIAGGTEAYKISEIPLIPEEYHYGLVYKPCWLYYLGKRNGQMAAQFKALYDEVARNIKPEEDNSTNQVVKIGSTEIKNINDYPRI